MHKKPLRKIQLTTTTVRMLSSDQAAHVAGGAITVGPTCTLTVSTGPYPSHGPCSLPPSTIPV